MPAVALSSPAPPQRSGTVSHRARHSFAGKISGEIAHLTSREGARKRGEPHRCRSPGFPFPTTRSGKETAAHPSLRLAQPFHRFDLPNGGNARRSIDEAVFARRKLLIRDH